jgi:energy-coupling factor transporter ATP-binding protein EcfA2
MARSNQFGRLLKQHCDTLELKPKEFSDHVRYAEGTIASWRTGRLRPAPEAVTHVAERLGFVPGSKNYTDLVAAAEADRAADRAAAQGSMRPPTQSTVEPTPVAPIPSSDLAPLLPREATFRRLLRLRVAQYWVESELTPIRELSALLSLTLEFVPTTAQDRWNEVSPTPATQKLFVESRQLTDLLAEKPGLLAILGEPGSGKSTILVAAAERLLEEAERDGDAPVAVIFPLASWANHRMPMVDWLAEQLEERYDIPSTDGRQLIAENHILCLFDGLDEVRSDARIACVEAINAFMHSHLATGLLCCRLEEFQQVKGRLFTQGRLIVQPLRQEQIDTYLDHAGPAGTTLEAALQNDRELARLSIIPLMLYILLQVQLKGLEELHQGQDGSHISSATIWQMYLDRMLTRKRSTTPGQKEPERQENTNSVADTTLLQTRRRLAWMAEYLQRVSQHELRVDHLQVDALPPRYRWQYAVLDRLGVALLTGALFSLGLAAIIVSYGLVSGKYSSYYADIPGDVFRFGLLGMLIGGLLDAGTPSSRRLTGRRRFGLLLTHCLFAGIVFGAIGYALTELQGSAVVFAAAAVCAAILTRGVGLGARYIDVVSSREWSWPRVRQMLPLGATIGAIGGLVAAFTVGQADGILGQMVSAPVANVLAGLFLGMLTSLMFGFAEHGPREKPATLNEGILRSARNARIGGILGALIGACFGLLVGAGPATWLIIGWSGGITAALGFGGYACLSHAALRFLLWRHNLFPWKYAPFLEDCTERTLLRRIGGGVQFFHPMLAQYLRASAEPKSPATLRSVEDHPPTRTQRRGRMIHTFARPALWKVLVAIVACILFFSVPPASQRVITQRMNPVAFDLTIQQDVVVFAPTIHTGDRITIIPSGVFYLGPFSGISTTQGKDRDELGFPFGQAFNLVQTAPMASLLCRVETITDRRVGRAWQLCDTPMTFTAANDGQLMFLINTTDSPNHRGHYAVEILVEPKPLSQPLSP